MSGGPGADAAVDVVMPRLSDSMEDGKILAWLKQSGERVAWRDELAEYPTDGSRRIEPRTLMSATREAHAAGAAVVDIHLRDEQQRPTADPAVASPWGRGE